MPEMSLRIECVVSAPFAENTFIVSRPNQPACLIIDPGFEPQKIEEVVRQHNLVPVAILNTHGHSDHIAGNQRCKQLWPDCPLVIGVGDASKLTNPDENLSGPFGLPLISPPADRTVVEGETLTYANIELEVLETPGHSSGHVVFVWKGSDPWIVFGGDVLFQGSIGRSDFPDSNPSDLIASIHNKLFVMPPDTVVLPGHGPMTQIGDEMRSNPYVGQHARYRTKSD